MMPETDPFLGVIVESVLVDIMKKAIGRTTAYRNSYNKTDYAKDIKSIHSKQEMQPLMEAKASTNCTHRGTESIKS